MKREYKIGDKVQLQKPKDLIEGPSWVEGDMDQFLGKTVTIDFLWVPPPQTGATQYFRIKECKTGYSYDSRWVKSNLNMSERR